MVTAAVAHDPDAIRVVPLQVAELPAAAPGAGPQLTYRNGPLLASVEVFTVFWGTAWEQAPQSDLIPKINGFFDTILQSTLMDQMGEYSVPNYEIGPGKRTGSATLTAPALHHSITDNAIQRMLQAELNRAGTQLPQPSPNTLYFLYFPPHVSVVQGGGRSCTVFCGYHNDINGTIFYAVMPYPGCAGCTGGLAPFDALTSTSSHELCEAITDAAPGTGWYDDVHGEIGDICAWKTKQLDGYTVQLEWSNNQNACI
jgi:hypothetical protein